MSDHEFERTYELLDLNDPPLLANENDTHFIYFCPNCVEKKGTPDEKGKLFFDKHDHKGLCFRCNTAFFPVVHEDATGKTDPKLNQIVNNIYRTMEGSSFTEPTPMAFNFDPLKPPDLKYLKSRHHFLPMLAPILGFKSWYGSKSGIVIPYLYKNFVATFQVRFDTTEHGKRYYIPKGSEKIPYSPEHLLTTFKLGANETITICEGWADAVALWIMGYPHPIAVQGSVISDYQVPIFRKLMPDNAVIIMDDYGKSEALRNDIKKKIPSIAGTKIINFGNDVDPEEHLKAEIRNPAKMKQYFQNTLDILRDKIT